MLGKTQGDNARKDLILFDVDGTLLNTSKGILSSIDYALDSHGLTLPDSFDRSELIGPPIQKSFARLFPSLSENEIKELSAAFREHYKNVDLLKADFYPSMEYVLKTLFARGYCLGVATYKREDYAVELMHAFGVDRYAKVIHGQDMAGKMTKADVIRLCIQEAGHTPDTTIMVGDSLSDEEGAKDVGCLFLPVTYGFGYKTGHVFSGPRIVGIADKPLDILEVLS